MTTAFSQSNEPVRAEPGALSGVSVVALLVACLVLAAPLVDPGRDGLALLLWLALATFPVGCWLAALTNGYASTLAWVVLAALTWAGLPSPSFSTFASTLAALLGNLLVGTALGYGARRKGTDGAAFAGATGRAALVLTLAVVAGAAASLGGVRGAGPWPPVVVARLLDISPLTLVAESAAVDWMRHPLVYEPAGTASIGPELRLPWGSLAGGVWFVVGCALALRVRRGARHDTGPGGR